MACRMRGAHLLAREALAVDDGGPLDLGAVARGHLLRRQHVLVHGVGAALADIAAISLGCSCRGRGWGGADSERRSGLAADRSGAPYRGSGALRKPDRPDPHPTFRWGSLLLLVHAIFDL